MGSDETVGLSPAEASARLARYGENKTTSEKPPYIWEVASAQLRDPMNIMLVAVTVVSLVIGQVPTAILVALLVLLNVVLGTRQELAARASVDALSKMQLPRTWVVPSSQVVLVPAFDVVPGDIVQVEAGRHCARRRQDHPVCHSGNAGGSPDRRERAYPQRQHQVAVG